MFVHSFGHRWTHASVLRGWRTDPFRPLSTVRWNRLDPIDGWEDVCFSTPEGTSSHWTS